MARTRNKETQAQQYGVIDDFKIERPRETKAGIFFSLVINGVTINNCRIAEYKKAFISLPSYKGSDGKYYNVVWFSFSPQDQDAIINAVYDELDNNK